MSELKTLMSERRMKANRAARMLGLPVSSAYRKLRQPPPGGVGAPPDARTIDPSDEATKDAMREVKKNRPYWGHRRVRAKLKKEHGIKIGRKRAIRLMREAGLLCPRKRFKPKRKHVPQPAATAPRQAWQIDMTSFVLQNLLTLYLVLVIDVFNRKIVGWKLSRRCRADEWLEALDAAVIAEFPEGVRGKGLTLRADNGSQPTSRKFVEHLDVLGITGEWTGYNTPESNAYVERVIRTVKEDGIWPNEFEDEAEAQTAIARTIAEYNAGYPHSSLGYMSPLEFEEAWQNGLVNVEKYVDEKGRTKCRLRLSQKAA